MTTTGPLDEIFPLKEDTEEKITETNSKKKRDAKTEFNDEEHSMKRAKSRLMEM